MKIFKAFIILATIAFIDIAFSQSGYTAENYPNPTRNEFKKCNMKSKSQICDVDQILPNDARYFLNHEAQKLEQTTQQDQMRDYCERKGISAGVAFAKVIGSGSLDDIKTVANDMLSKWSLDAQCQKQIIILIATDSKKMWIARGDSVPIYSNELTEIPKAESALLKKGDYKTAVSNILKNIGQNVLSKQSVSTDNIGGPQRPVVDPTPQGLLCCCGCLYCCCCRGKSETNPESGDPNGGQGNGGGSSGFGGFGRILQSVGIAQIINMVMPFIRNLMSGNRGNNAPATNPGYTPGAKFDDAPAKSYPNKKVTDTGGGVEW
uniref:TPM_phosphatase domain-containing protein n=1 Tax=Rhabditophanes sp. KR3021 TaxID=114890 RepID=A0AC35UGG0_9BILA